MKRGIISVCLAMLVSSVGRGQQQPRYNEEVNVNRVLIDVRAVDDGGRAIAGLTADNFKVKVDGKGARVESARWTAGAADGTTERRVASPTPHADAPSSGRIVVLLFQKDMEPSRIVGLMRMLVEVRQVLASLGPADRVAVLSYDSRLRVWLDLTNDFDRVRQVLSHDVLFGGASVAQESEAPSLLDHLDRHALDHAYPIERALSLVGSALEPLPGAKSLVLVGYGFGRLSQSGLNMEAGYANAVAALQRARASVFCLDVTDADFHSLEGGLQLVADQTGGFYAKTHLFPQLALDRLSGALSGYYTLFVDLSARLRPGSHDMQVTLAGVKGTVLATERLIK